MMISQLDPRNLNLTLIDQLLFDYMDDGEAGDCIYVPGSSKCIEYRVPVAVDLFKQGRARKVLFSGGMVWISLGQLKPEAILMKEKAIELGVPEDAILVETQSQNTQANVIESASILDREIGLQHVSRIILVTTAYHMRRLYLTMKTHLPNIIEYSCCPAQDTSTRRDNWWLNQNGTKRVTQEAAKLIDYVQRGVLADGYLESETMDTR